MDDQENIVFESGKNRRSFCDNALDEKRFSAPVRTGCNEFVFEEKVVDDKNGR